MQVPSSQHFQNLLPRTTTANDEQPHGSCCNQIQEQMGLSTASRNTMNTKQNVNHVLLSIQVLMRFLELKDYDMFIQAKTVVTACSNFHKSNTPGYESLQIAVLKQLRQKVGETNWKRCKMLSIQLRKKFDARTKQMLEALVEHEVTVNDLVGVIRHGSTNSQQSTVNEKKKHQNPLNTTTATILATYGISQQNEHHLKAAVKADGRVSSEQVVAPPSPLALQVLGNLEPKQTLDGDPCIQTTSTAEKSPLSSIDCVICGDDYKEGDFVCLSNTSSCIHAFHTECLLKWLINNDSCPLCRSTFFTIV
jgi:hypothetical protein